ncbi:MAG: PrsW family intramembrane metalloprotease [Acidobacteriota bacterium]|nr:PrsW family intramembrane metalloprotease [Acidobacteriota bacterium]
MTRFISRYRRRQTLLLWGPLVVISFLAFVTALVVWLYMMRNVTPNQRFLRAIDREEIETAEQIAWQMLQEKPEDLARWIRFVDVHTSMTGDADEGSPNPTVSQSSVHKLIAGIGDARVRTIAAYWYDVRTAETAPDPAAITGLADANPPQKFANYVLARVALLKKDWRTAANRFEREGLAFPSDRQRDLRRAIAIWIDHDAWNAVRRRIRDPRYDSALDASLRLDIATHEHDWLRILVWIWPAGFVHWNAWPIALAVLAATLWLVIAVRLGRVQDGVPGRRRLYALAFILGILSVYPTLLTITVEEEFLGLKELGGFVPDLIYFIFAVALREEGWKIILFLPLVPALLRRGSRIEAMTCGALVGLGFAAEENIGYFHRFGAEATLPRFLTANFFHMSLTAVVALSVFDTRRGRAAEDRFNVIFPLAIIIHGAYDFFLTTNDMPLSSIFSTLLLIIISRQFLRQLLIATSKAEERGALYLLIASMALITGVSYVYATTLVGPWGAFRLIAIGIVGVAIVIYMFVRELSPG